MIIYDVYYDDGDYPNGLCQGGIYTNFETAKAEAEKDSQYTVVMFIRVMELVDGEFKVTQVWHKDVDSSEGDWCLEED